MSGPVTGTPFPLVPDDGGRKAAGFDGVTDRDCVTRAIAIGTGLPYEKVHDMVNEAAWELGQKADDPAETGADGRVAPKILVRGRGWRHFDLSRSARLTLEDLRPPLSEHSVLVVETELDLTVKEAALWGTYHLTAVVNGEVHDLPSMGAAGYARTDRVKNVFGRPQT
jgi:hypothetical protein